MQKKGLWFVFAVIGVMAATTICYLSMRDQIGKQYADGKLVQLENNQWDVSFVDGVQDKQGQKGE
ncbi:MAG: hypothetical protein MR316_06630 [Lachnospiraceae bacterium]|nr:hypothetical protein [Lachnospiraceae bacterium]